MNRQEIYKEIETWAKQNKETHSCFVLLVEKGSKAGLEASAAISGDGDDVCNALCDIMYRRPRTADIILDAVERYKTRSSKD